MEKVWSNTDFPYFCLKDKIRTEAFRKAINKSVKKGDIVIDAGAGSGILSFFAAESGAKKVYSVEIEPLLAFHLRRSIKKNKLSKVIKVVEGNILDVDLPHANVLIAEMIETGLLDELQVPGLNCLRQKGVITSKTSIIPKHYKTFLQLVYVDNLYYGYQILMPKHEWPFYKDRNTNWFPTKIVPVSDLVEVNYTDFSLGIIEENVNLAVVFNLNKNKKANAVKLSGVITLSDGIELGPTNALNGDKIFPLEPLNGVSQVQLKVSYKMGGGMRSLKIELDNS